MATTGTFHDVNDSIRQLATAGPSAETWEFFCECTDRGCRALVSLTLSDFDERRTASPPRPILASHHEQLSA
jgi:hypothetical protein